MKDEESRFISNALWAQRALLAFSMLWLVFQYSFYREILFYRPRILFEPGHPIGKLLTPFFPGMVLYHIVAILTLVAGATLLLYPRINQNRSLVLRRLICAIGLAWINTVHWSYGYTSHVGHFLLLSNLFAIFIPLQREHADDKEWLPAFRWYYAGLLFTYTLSAAWKVLNALKGIVTNTVADTWLNPEGLVSTSLSGYAMSDQRVPELLRNCLEHPVLLSIGFWMTTVIMLLSPLSVFRNSWFRITLILLVCFHALNSYFLRADFFTTMIVLVLFAFPYHLLKQERRISSLGKAS